MLTNRIIGRVGANILAQRISNHGQTGELAALFRLDKLSANQIAAVAQAILANPDLRAKVDLMIPEALVEGQGLPPEILIPHNAGYVRNNPTTAKAAILTANGNEHNLADTLGHVMALGAKEMRADPESWVEATLHSGGIAPVSGDRAVFQAALGGLLATSELSLVQLGEFCAAIVEASTLRGLPIRDAIGFALPCAGLPRDSSYFSSAKIFVALRKPWHKAFTNLFAQRAPLLKKLRPNGQPLDSEEISERIEANAAEISDAARQALEAFAAAPAGDQEASDALAHFEWESDGVYLAFDKPKEKQLGLAVSTIHFFDHECDQESSLDDEGRKLLEELHSRERRSEFTEEDEAFFVKQRRLLEQDPKLCSRWEKALYGKPIDCNDFLEGFTRVVHSLHAGLRDPQGERILRFTVNKGRTEWRERFNYDAGCFFSAMYRGLKELMGAKVDWKVTRMTTANLPDPLFDFERYFSKEKELATSRNKKLKAQGSLSRTAMQIKFDVELLGVTGGIETKLAKTQLLWSYKPTYIGLSMVADMKRLLEKGAVGCTEVPRRLVSKKGGVQSVSLLDTGTLEATYSADAGSLVPATSRLRSLCQEIKNRIKELAQEGRLTQDQHNEVKASWDTFEQDYISAMEGFLKTGLHGDAVMRQAESFASLLNTLMAHARGDVCRSRLVSEVLSIGTARIVGDNPAIIIPPWHPERMKALAVKTRRVAGFASHLLSSSSILYGDREIFMRELSDEIAHPFYPEIAVLNRDGAMMLVSASSTVNGYSLLESPTHGAKEAMTDVDPTAAAKQARELLERYVGLQPHEANNLSVVLYNADAAELPLATVRELSSIQEDGKLQCSVSVRHSDPSKLRRIYGELVNKAGDDPDLPVVSETSDNFMSKLRISVTPLSATPGESAQGFKAFDVAFLHDVVARAAQTEWLPVPWTNDRPNVEHAPSRWSYRSASGENELKSTTFLACPWQTATGWAYVSAVAAVCRQTDALPEERFLPARRISLQSPDLASMIKDAHELAEWVATYDELLDKRQLQHNNITVVRYRRGSTNGRNMIVSSTSELRLLDVLVRRRLQELNLQLQPAEIQSVADKAKRDALSISGDIVLRAAKRGVSAGEMIGLVLSRYLLAEEFKAADGRSLTAYFLLDDYASWLSQPESRIADILALNVEEYDDTVRVGISIVESKYVGVDGLANARRGSKDQLLATLGIFREALFGDPGRLDRDVWLARLADMLIDADVPPGMSGLMERARAKLREGNVEISLRGYSHVYIHNSDAGLVSASDQELLDDTEGVKAWQEVFDRPDLRKLVETYAKGVGAHEARASLGAQQPWSGHTFKKPAPRVQWLAKLDQLTCEQAQTPDEESSDIDVVATDQIHTVATPSVVLVEPTQLSPTDTVSPSREVAATVTNLGSALSKLVASKFAGNAQVDAERDEWAKDVTQKLKAALNSYGLQAAVLGTRLTPNGCLVRLAGSDRLRVEDIENKRTQLLTTHAISLVTVQPKPGEIVVTVAGAKRQAVSLWELWSRREPNRNIAGINTSFLLGLQEINGALLYLNLGSEFGGLSSHEPHSLVAGATGSGKSVLIQALLLDIAATNPKDLAQIILIDPKMGVDYAPLADLPHMRDEIVTTKEKAAEVLDALVEEMEERYRAFARIRARDLPSYNSKASVEERLPMIFLVHDEFADWMLDDAYKAAVGAAVQRLGVKARAAGIHLIFAAQRPDKDVMPMQLRENLGNRLILKVSSEATSKIALDRPGAELLLGRGHLAAKLNGEQGLVFAQAPFLSDLDIEAAVAAIRIDNSNQ
ncbi:FtsK/SpoIIIE domain-containing protein [Dickeya fangzhongdai]|uniref:DNA translocase FtsK n=1 Tax=Dickeya fangzhongdai TaxID=1778540 RepID=A0A2K8QQV4_9GAMM|nr:FtsK/SpoIIIE domain-containing protein [Dickeya fangzhongdai]ATZ95762.1 DNA translocase FtsK [Dickeya fangzhongdai]QOH49207.1 DNA translocase FtsK [Dickeya fangzhongdai]QOH53510.1 DNA translocase FtsK [Dickeya fangzhongdai]WOX99292.1 FtsK/SpoIIIE domain-containing protein [Dickeya fangzhongdai]WOY05556.1 FtsK/SpoIIIE domain-containing protein [Dickeya fangzhongdai]